MQSAIYSYTAGEFKLLSKFNFAMFPVLLLLEFKEFRKLCKVLNQYFHSLLAVGEYVLESERSGSKYFSIV